MYKKLLSALMVGVFVLTVIGCTVVRVEAPVGEKIKLSSETESYNYVAKKRVFYVLWGLVPITDNSTAKMLEGKKVESVKIEAKYDIVDILINVILGHFTVVSRTIEVKARVSQ